MRKAAIFAYGERIAIDSFSWHRYDYYIISLINM